ncbi:MAG: polymorphic toxin-type HINT domain-containing protein [Gemmataceae bacterium]
MVDPSDRIATVTDPKNQSTIYRFDDGGRIARVIDPLGNWKQYDRDSAGRVLTYTDPVHIVSYHYDARGNLDETQGEDSDTTALFDRKFNLPIRTTDARGFSTHYVLNTQTGDVLEERQPAILIDGVATPVILQYGWTEGLMTSSRNARGYATIFVYDERRRLLRSVDPLGNTTTWLYDSRGNPSSVEDPPKNRYITEYDANSRLDTERFADGGVVRREYLANGLLSTITYQNGSKTRYEYNARGQLTTLTEAVDDAQSQRSSAYVYDLAGNLIEKTEGISSIAGYQHLVRTRYAYDAANRLTTIIEGYGSSVARTRSRVYDSANRLTSETDGRGIVTAYQYDSKDRVTVVTEDAGEGGSYFNRKTTTIYDAVGNILEIQKPEGRITKYAYDSHNRVTTLTEAAGSPVERKTSTEYDIGGNVRRTTDAMGVKTEYLYDRAGRLKVSIEAVGTEFERSRFYFYNAAGKLNERLDPVGLPGEQIWVSTFFGYDSLNRNVSSITGFRYVGSPVLSLSEFADSEIPLAPISLIRDFNGPNATATTRRQFDRSGNILFETDTHQQTTTYLYDALNRPIGIFEAGQQVTSTHFDRGTTMLYDAAGNLAAKTTGLVGLASGGPGSSPSRTPRPVPNILETLFGYNGLNQRTTMIQAFDVGSANLGHSAPVTAYGYDDAGNLRDAVDPRGIVTHYSYDRLNRLETTTQNYTELLGDSSIVTWQRYDLNDNVVLSVDGRRVETKYQFDQLNRKTKTIQGFFVPANISSQPQAFEVSTDYDAADRVIASTDGRGTTSRSIYDALGRRIAVIEAFGTSAARMTTFLHDAADRLRSQTTGYVVREDAVYTAGIGYTIDLYGPETAVPPLDLIDSASANRKTSQTDWKYDDIGRVKSETRAAEFVDDAAAFGEFDHVRPVTFYEYGSNGRVRRIATMVESPDNVLNPDRTFTFSQFDYDSLGRVTRKSDGTAKGSWNATTAVFVGNDDILRYSTSSYNANGLVVDQTENSSASAEFRDASLRTTYLYDPLGRLRDKTTAVGTNAVRSTYLFDIGGNLIGETNGIRGSTNTSSDEAITATSYGYDAFNRRNLEIRGVNVANFNLRPELIPIEYVVPVTQHVRPQYAYKYDENGNLTQLTDPLGVETRFGYDAFNRQVKTIQAANDVFDNTLTPTDKDGQRLIPTTETEFDANGNVVRMVDANGNVTVKEYDRLNRVTTIIEAQNSPVQRTSTFKYDAASNMVLSVVGDSPTESLKHVTTTIYSFDSLGRLRSTQSGVGSGDMGISHDYKYFVDGKLKLDEGKIRSSTHESQLGAELNSFGKTEYLYNSLRGAREVRENFDLPSLRRVTTLAYDAADRVVRKVDASGIGIATEYDAQGRVKEVRNDHSRIVLQSFEYDTLGNSRIERNLTGETQRRYDVLGRVVSQQNYTYGKDRSATTWREPPTWYIYDIAGNLTGTRQQQNVFDQNVSATQTTSFNAVRNVYDALGRVVSSFNSADKERQYRYDAAGNVTRMVDRDNNVTVNTFDELGRLSQTTWGTTANNQISATLTYVRDAQNNLRSSSVSLGNDPITHQASVSTNTRTYDKLNRVKDEALASGVTLGHNYSYVGGYFIESLDTMYAGTTVTQKSAYDADTRLAVRRIEIGTKVVAAAAFEYHTNQNNVGVVTLTSGGDSTKAIRESDGTATVSHVIRYSYNFRLGGPNVSSKRYTLPGNRDVEFFGTEYTDIGKISRDERIATTGNDVKDTGYSYDFSRIYLDNDDADGAQGQNNNAGTSTSIVYVNGNRVSTKTKLQPDNVLVADEYISLYDVSGEGRVLSERSRYGIAATNNQTAIYRRHLQTYTYDAAGHLTGVDTESDALQNNAVYRELTAASSFRYDAEGNRIANKRSDTFNPGSSAPVQPELDGWVSRNAVSSGQFSYSFVRGNGQLLGLATSSGGLFKQFLLGPTGEALAEITSTVSGSSTITQWFATDNQNSVVAMLNDSRATNQGGRVDQRYLYDSFGNLEKGTRGEYSVGGGGGSYEGTVQTSDQETRLGVYESRYLSTFGYQGREVLAVNRYMPSVQGAASDLVRVYEQATKTLNFLMDFGGAAYNTRNGRYLTSVTDGSFTSNGYRFQDNAPGNRGALGKPTTVAERVKQEDRLYVDSSWWKAPEWVSYIPVVGSVWNAAYHFRQGEIGLGLMNAAFAAFDVGMLVVGAFTAGAGTAGGQALKAGIFATLRNKLAQGAVGRAIISNVGQRGISAGIGGVTGFAQTALSGGSWQQASQAMVAGAANGFVTPGMSTYGRALGTIAGAAAGSLAGERGTALGAQIGGLAGGMVGANAWAVMERHGNSAFWHPMAKVSAFQGGATILGGGLGYMANGVEGMFAGANLGQMAANAAMMANPQLREWLLRACFTADMKLMARGPWGEGWRAIVLITTDDEVLSRDESNPHGPLVWKKVEETFQRLGRVRNIVMQGGHVLRTTDEHPLYVIGKDFVAAGEVHVGDLFTSHDGQTVEVLDSQDTEVYETVYNLRVADFHTYFVGCDEWGFSVWAHNAACVVETENGEYVLKERGTGKELARGSQSDIRKFADANSHTIIDEASNARFQKIFKDVELPEIPGNYAGKTPQEIAALLPEMKPIFIRQGGKTICLEPMTGVLVDRATGKAYSVMSGWKGSGTTTEGGVTFKPGALKQGVAAEAGGVWKDLGSHLEGQSTAFMHATGMTAADLYISGTTPCLRGGVGCFYRLNEMLPAGSQLTVHGRNGTPFNYP